MKFERLFSPLQVGTLTLKNRIVMLPMGTGMADNGYLTDAQIDYYVARAKGGVGLIVVEFTTCHESSRTPLNVSLHDDSYIPRWRELVTAVHSHGAAIFPQLAHFGNQSLSVLTGHPLLAPSAVACPMMREVPQALTQKQIAGLVEGFGQAALRAKQAGCDGVEVHGAHGYLINNFMSPFSNKRVDAYGGGVQGRMRFPVEIITKIKSYCGNDFPVCFRMCSDEMLPGGIRPEEAMLTAGMAADAGADIISVTRATYGSIKWIFPPHGTATALTAAFTEKLKKVLKVPVIAAHRINDPLVAEHVLALGQADLIGMGRALIADADLPRKAAEDRIEDIVPCIGCNQGCLGRIMEQKSVTCMVNPSSGRERELPIVPAAKRKKVLVVGGGVAGMEAARIAALRGHAVTLCEKTDKLGGQFNLASVPPNKQEFTKVVCYFSSQLKKAGVQVRMETEITPRLIAEGKWDVVVIATGAVPVIPQGIPGVEKPIVSTGHDVLDGRVVIGAKVVVIGGGMVGCEVAEYAAERGAGEVTILEMLPDIASEAVTFSNRQFLMEYLSAHQVRILTETKVKEILDDGVVYTKDDIEHAIRNVTNVILAVGADSFDPLSQKLAGTVPEVHVIGDARQVLMAKDAIEEATRLARRI